MTNQVDLIYSKNNTDITKRTTVALEFQHALARLSVTANAAAYTDGLTFTVTDIAISGPFNTVGTFDLAKGVWTSKTTPATKPYDLTATTGQLLTTTAYNFSENEKNYMMMIPTEFSATNKATLTVTYTMTYKGEVSKPVSKNVEITTSFEQGKAYTINLTFQRDETNAITFNVTSVGGWETGSTQTPTING